MVLYFVKELMMLTDFENHMLMTKINIHNFKKQQVAVIDFELALLLSTLFGVHAPGS